MKSLRHGEIVIKPVTKIGTGERQQATSYIVGHSETGHHHERGFTWGYNTAIREIKSMLEENGE